MSIGEEVNSMANQEHLDLLKQGVACWNDWRAKNPTIPPDLKRAELARIDLHKANLSDTYLNEANLSQAHLREANLVGADLSKADLRQATLCYANLTWANLSEADLAAADRTGANLSWASLRLADLSAGKLIGTNLSGANLTEGNLSQANLNNAILVRTILQRANLTACSIYGVSIWDVQLEGVIQANLIITLPGAPTITVDDLEVAQFIYLLLNNKKLRDVIDTITSKVVLTLAHLSRFIIVDLTDPSSAPHEVATVIPQCVVPVQPLLSLQPLIGDEKEVERREYAMFQDLRRRYSWVLLTFRYQDTADVLASLKEKIIDPAELKVKELVQQK